MAFVICMRRVGRGFPCVWRGVGVWLGGALVNGLMDCQGFFGYFGLRVFLLVFGVVSVLFWGWLSGFGGGLGARFFGMLGRWGGSEVFFLAG